MDLKLSNKEIIFYLSLISTILFLLILVLNNKEIEFLIKIFSAIVIPYLIFRNAKNENRRYLIWTSFSIISGIYGANIIGILYSILPVKVNNDSKEPKTETPDQVGKKEILPHLNNFSAKILGIMYIFLLILMFFIGPIMFVMMLFHLKSIITWLLMILLFILPVSIITSLLYLFKKDFDNTLSNRILVYTPLFIVGLFIAIFMIDIIEETLNSIIKDIIRILRNLLN